MIKPTVGRVIWIRNRPEQIDRAQPETAQIVYVHSDRCVNVAGYDHEGQPFRITSLVLRQDDDDPQSDEHWQMCHGEWMPYQLGQAARTQQAEERVAAHDFQREHGN